MLFDNILSFSLKHWQVYLHYFMITVYCDPWGILRILWVKSRFWVNIHVNSVINFHNKIFNISTKFVITKQTCPASCIFGCIWIQNTSVLLILCDTVSYWFCLHQIFCSRPRKSKYLANFQEVKVTKYWIFFLNKSFLELTYSLIFRNF